LDKLLLFLQKVSRFLGIRSPEKLQSEKVRHDLPIYVGNFGFGGVLQLAKPAGRNFARLAFDVGKLFFQKKWVNIRSNELRQFVKMSFGSDLVWASRKDFPLSLSSVQIRPRSSANLAR